MTRAIEEASGQVLGSGLALGEIGGPGTNGGPVDRSLDGSASGAAADRRKGGGDEAGWNHFVTALMVGSAREQQITQEGYTLSCAMFTVVLVILAVCMVVPGRDLNENRGL